MRHIGRTVQNWTPGPDDPIGLADVKSTDWEHLTLVPPEGENATRWISVERNYCIPIEETL